MKDLKGKAGVALKPLSFSLNCSPHNLSKIILDKAFIRFCICGGCDTVILKLEWWWWVGAT